MKRTLIAVAAIFLLPALCPAQTGSLTILTSPPGAGVELQGEANLSGVSPITFSYRLVGKYRLKVTKHGYESYSTTLILDPAQPQQVEVKLSPKTAGKAVLRSFLIPGWGQRYSGQRTKSLLFGALFFGSAINLYKTHDRYVDRRDEYTLRLNEYDEALTNSGTITDINRRYSDLLEAQQAAYDAESDRRLATSIAIGIWGLNLIDALLFTPSERATFSIKGLTVAPSASSSSAGLTLTMAF